MVLEDAYEFKKGTQDIRNVDEPVCLATVNQLFKKYCVHKREGTKTKQKTRSRTFKHSSS